MISAIGTDDEEVAIKYLDPSQVTTDRRKRFQNEIRFGQRIDHPNIVKILDVGEVDVGGRSSPFYVMPRYPRALRALIGKSLAHADVLDVFGSILNGIEAAHLNKVWHRDLKPENILVSEDHKSIVVADFGIAYFSDPQLYEAVQTKHTDRLANFRYCAPEQVAQGVSRNAAVDIYALGLMLNEMFTGHVPRGTGYATIGSVAPTFAYLDPIVETMIQQDPARRISTIDSIKIAISSSGAVELARQELNAKKKAVVSSEDPQDPLFENPIKIIGFDWQDNVLTLNLSSVPPPTWIEEFRNRGHDSMILGTAPREVSVTTRGTIVARANENNAQKVIDAYKRHLVKTNALYETRIRSEHRETLHRKQHAARQAASAAEQRLRVLRSLKLD